MPKRFIRSLVIVSVATVLAMVSDRRGFEELAERAAIADQANAPDTKCPLSREYIDKADIGLLSICLTLGLFRSSRARPRARVHQRRRAQAHGGDGQAEVDSIRMSVYAITNFGLTLSKLSAAASLLGGSGETVTLTCYG
jgi:hypothetical protein